jgi:hypothetical protein
MKFEYFNPDTVKVGDLFVDSRGLVDCYYRIVEFNTDDTYWFYKVNVVFFSFIDYNPVQMHYSAIDFEPLRKVDIITLNFLEDLYEVKRNIYV